MAKQRILVADDSRDVAAFLQGYLSQQGYEVQVAYDGETAVRLFTTQPFDLVLTDLQMPRLNGLGVLHRVKERAKETQVIILTGHASLDTALDALRHGAYDYLLKPVENVDQLQFTIDRALLQRSLEIDNRRLVNELKQANAHLEQTVAEQTRELREAYAQLQSLDRMKSEFVSIVSHELRTPLSVILLAAQLLNEGNSLPSERQREHLSNIQTYSRRLKRLVDNLLDFSLLERGELQLEVDQVSVAEVIRETHELYSSRARDKGVALQAVPPPTDVRIPADPARLANALGHLVDNAIKFTPKGGRVVLGAHSPVQGPGQTPRPHVVIGVADSGVGIPVERQRLLFKAFTQADMSDRRHFEGIGLGLALAHRIVVAHGGQITLKSEPGKGSTFAIWLPLTDVNPRSHTNEHE
ncbi:MAG TPA: hybrid sensor histidine kinase/response regulator [Anaerolineae bacterium]|nr:hybrid sensor histidine kinase/response regulator [Anaerolineae bacterium]